MIYYEELYNKGGPYVWDEKTVARFLNIDPPALDDFEEREEWWDVWGPIYIAKRAQAMVIAQNGVVEEMEKELDKLKDE